MNAGEERHETALSRDSDGGIASLPIGVLHLGIKTVMLRQAGFRTVENVAEADPEVLARIPLVGWRTVNQLVRNRRALAGAARPHAGMDWSGYCQEIGVPLLPAGEMPATGGAFLQALPAFLDALATHLSDEIFAVILRERICQPPGRQMTLDEIAAGTSPRLSRERIRQKEKKLLGQLTGGLLSDSYDGLDIHFHPDFSRWWRMASDALAGIDDIEVQAFVDLLCDVWNVSQGEVMARLPIILAIVTGEPQMSGGFRSASKLSPRLFSPLDNELQNLPVMRVRFGKYAAVLEEAGLPLLGDVIARLRSDGLAAAGPTAAGYVTRHLDLFAGCITPDGGADWTAYRDVAGLVRLPVSAPASAADFVNGLCAAIEALLRLHPVSKRAPEIFLRRTSRDAAIRMTLQQVADDLQTHLPTVKREESVLLAWLYDAIIDRDFSGLRVWLDESWLRYWSEALAVYDTADDYAGFAGNLEWRWRLTAREIRQAAPLLWAVLDGYPDGRRSGYTPPVTAPAEAAPVGRIRLKGFRRLH